MKRHTIISRSILSLFTLINLRTIPPAIPAPIEMKDISHSALQTIQNYPTFRHPGTAQNFAA